MTNLFNFCTASVREMELICYTTGKTSLSDISKADLCTLDPFLSRAIGVDLGYVSHEEQEEYFDGFAKLNIGDLASVDYANHDKQEQPLN